MWYSAKDPFNYDVDLDLDPDHGYALEKWIRTQVISLRFILRTNNFQFFVLFFCSLIFILNHLGNFSDMGFRGLKVFFGSFRLIFYPLDSDPQIFADPDPGSQNLVDPTDQYLDPKHWYNTSLFILHMTLFP